MKKILYVILAIVIMMSATGCDYNYQHVDTNWSFNYAYILLPNGECVEGKVDSWRDYEDGDQLQITINGVTYLTDTTRAVLVRNRS